jgi:hypothetical protein
MNLPIKMNKGEIKLTPESQLPSLTHQQMEVLRRFALFEASAEELARTLAGVFELNLVARETLAVGSAPARTASTQFRVPEPGIVITREHIQNALERRRFGLVSERDLVVWATVLLMNDAYALDPGDEDLIAEWLNDISLNLDAS